jgi:hypothetical protein
MVVYCFRHARSLTARREWLSAVRFGSPHEKLVGEEIQDYLQNIYSQVEFSSLTCGSLWFVPSSAKRLAPKSEKS